MSWRMSLATLWTLLLRTYRGGGVAVQSRLAPGKRAVQAALEFHSCIAPAVGWGRQAAVVCF